MNPNKVAIIDGLEPVESRWVRKLRTHRYRDRSDSNMAADIVDLFDLAFDERQRYATQGVMSYAIMRCNPFPAGASSWPLYRDLVLASIGLEPSTLRHAYRVLRFAKDHGLPVDQDRVTEVLNELLGRHAELEHGFEAAWILFMLRELGLPLDSSSAQAVAGMGDVCSLILLLELASRPRPCVAWAGRRPPWGRPRSRGPVASSTGHRNTVLPPILPMSGQARGRDLEYGRRAEDSVGVASRC